MTFNIEPLMMHVAAWAMVMFRIAGIFMFAPMFSSQLILTRVKIFLAVGLSFCIYPMLLTPGSASAMLINPVIAATTIESLSLWTLIPAVAMELLIGLTIGYGSNLAVVGAQMGGQMIDQQMGLGFAGIYSPELNTQAGVISRYLGLFAIILFVIIGGHRAIIAVLMGSFGHIPLGGFRPDGHLLDLVLGLMSTMLEMALRVAAPVTCLLFLQTVALGFIMRTVPQLNILSIGFVLRIMVGGSILVGTVHLITELYNSTVIQMLDQIRMFFTGG